MLPSSYAVKVGETAFHKFSYQPIKLWEYVDQIRDGTLYVFAPLLPLLTRPIDEALLVEERQLILAHEKDDKRQRTLLTTAILIAAQSKLFSGDFLWSLFQEDEMDLDNPVIAKLLERAYREKLAEDKEKFAAEKEKLVAEKEKFEEQLHEEFAHRIAAAEAEATRQWYEMMLKVLEHRFTSVPVALVLLLQAVKPAMRSRASDIILDSEDAEACLQALQQLQADAAGA